MKARLCTKVRQHTNFTSRTALALGLALLAVLILAAEQEARSQTLYPRIGLSASPNEQVDTLEVVPGEEFTLYICVFGPYPGQPADQPFTSLSWVIHQVCCGAEVDITHFDFHPDLDSQGHPLVGVETTAETCYDQDSVVLATLTCTLDNPTPGGVLWAAGPYDASYDCLGGNALFMGMAVNITVDEDVLPVENSRWGSIKAMYR